MRKSLEDLNQSMVHEAPDYPGLPEELKEYCYWLADSGYCIMAVPEVLLKDHFGSMALWGYEVGMPVKYVLDKGWKHFEEYIVVDVPYDDEYGVRIPDGYDEF